VVVEEVRADLHLLPMVMAVKGDHVLLHCLGLPPGVRVLAALALIPRVLLHHSGLGELV
jgi:hypothetical protein